MTCRDVANIHECGNSSGSQVFPDEPLCAIPVESFCGVSNARKMHACFAGDRRQKDNLDFPTAIICSAELKEERAMAGKNYLK